MKTPQSVFVALSGGVDSAVAAYLLKDAGYDVTGVFMKNWSGEEFGVEDQCPWKEDQEMAEHTCKYLEIPFKTYNFEKEYRQEIITNFIDEYSRGNTPNPDILCNQFIKFGTFLKKALSDGADMIAAGHYSRVKKNRKGHFELLRAKDTGKDQTYFLYRLDQRQLSRTFFPLGDLTKKQVRSIAKKAGLPNADRKDSQGICFLGKIDVREFLDKTIAPKTGDIVDADTKEVVGKHNGAWYYTNGQREGLGIGGASKPYYVSGKDLKQNIVYVVQGDDHPSLYCSSVTINETHWIGEPPPQIKLRAMVRYRQPPQLCLFEGGTITFSKPIWKPSNGQSAVLIDGKKVLGGGIISSVSP